MRAELLPDERDDSALGSTAHQIIEAYIPHLSYLLNQTLSLLFSCYTYRYRVYSVAFTKQLEY